MIKGIRIAKDFANSIAPLKKRAKIEDIMLYGSIARKLRDQESEGAEDVDIMVLHRSNPVLQRFDEQTRKRRDIADIEKGRILQQELFDGGYLEEPLQLPRSVVSGLSREVLDIHFLEVIFFGDRPIEEVYRRLMVGLNSDPQFYQNVLDNGFLFNPVSGEFDMEAREKYRIPVFQVS